MDSRRLNQQTLDNWMNAENRPRIIRITRKSSPWYGMSEEEIEDRREYIRYYFCRELEPILIIPVEPQHHDFWFPSLQEFLDSAFNTHDFQKTRQPFDRYAYRVKKILEEVKDLALLHSCISSEEGRANTLRRYQNLVDYEFREKLLAAAQKYSVSLDEERRDAFRQKVVELNKRILQCKKMWEQCAPWDT
jgi:hypothetical protein